MFRYLISEVASYNQPSKEAADQLEIDVIGINSKNGKQTISVPHKAG